MSNQSSCDNPNDNKSELNKSIDKIYSLLLGNPALLSEFIKRFFRSYSNPIFGPFCDPNSLSNTLINLLRKCFKYADDEGKDIIISILRLIINEPKRLKEGPNEHCGYQNIISVQIEPPCGFNLRFYIVFLLWIITSGCNKTCNIISSKFINKKKEAKVICELNEFINNLNELIIDVDNKFIENPIHSLISNNSENS
jgi:hypothetical protein